MAQIGGKLTDKVKVLDLSGGMPRCKCINEWLMVHEDSPFEEVPYTEINC